MIVVQTTDTKRCNKCWKVKRVTEFWKNPKTKDGLRCQCKDCEKKSYKKRYTEDAEYREKRKAMSRQNVKVGYLKKYRSLHKDKVSEYNRRYNERKKLEAFRQVKEAVKCAK